MGVIIVCKDIIGIGNNEKRDDDVIWFGEFFCCDLVCCLIHGCFVIDVLSCVIGVHTMVATCVYECFNANQCQKDIKRFFICLNAL